MAWQNAGVDPCTGLADNPLPGVPLPGVDLPGVMLGRSYGYEDYIPDTEPPRQEEMECFDNAEVVEKPKRVMSDEQKAKMAEGRARARAEGRIHKPKARRLKKRVKA